jgi:protein disulfide-isomerase A6
MKLSLVLLVAVAATAVADYTSSDKVVILTEANFQEKVLQSDDLWMVEFYAPWCGHCKTLEPEWKKAAKQAGDGIKFGAVDATEHAQLASQYSVQGYPTIKVFGADKKKPKDYNSGRTASDLLQGAQRARSGQSGDSQKSNGDHPYGSDVVILGEDNFQAGISTGKLTLVKFYAPWCGHCKNMIPAWSAAATALKGEAVLAAVDATVDKELAQRYGVQGFPTIKVFLPGEETPQDYDGGRTDDAIVAYVHEKLADLGGGSILEQLTGPENFESGCSGKRLCVLTALPHLIDGGAAKRNQYLEILKELAPKHRLVGFMWYAAGEQNGLDEAMSISLYPTLSAVSFQKGRYSKHVHAFDVAHISSFLSKTPSSLPLSNKEPKIRSVTPWDGADYTPPVEEDEY